MLVLSLPIVIIFQNDTIVCADPPPQEPQFDFNYIYNITYKLSDIIYSSYGPNELAQGRFFATPGERDAAVYLADEMEKIGLYDPTNESTPNKPYREKITNLTIGSGYLFNKTFFNTDNLTTKLEILNRSLTLKNLTTGNITAIEECYISPRWNLTRIFPYPDKNTLTYCFNETDIHIEYPPANKQYFGIGNIS